MDPCCQQSVNLLFYLDNELVGLELEDFSAHLRICAVCQARLEEEQALSWLLHQSSPLHLAPASLRTRVRSAITQHLEANSKRRLPCEVILDFLRHACEALRNGLEARKQWRPRFW